jgi:hypothetical protein
MLMSFPRLILIAGLLAAAVSTAGAGSADEGFPTNLALLDRLSAEAVSAALDSLRFQSGDTVVVMTEGGNEGDGFIAGAFARELTRRGIAVHMTVETQPVAPPASTPVSPPVSQLPKGMIPGGLMGSPQDTTSAPADSLRSGAPPDSAQAPPQVGEPSGGNPSEDSGNPAPATATPAASTSGSKMVRKVYPAGTILEFRTLEFGVNYPSVKRRFKLFGSATVTRLGGVYVQASRISGPDGTVVGMANGQSYYQDRLSSKERRLAEGATYPFMKPSFPPSNFGRVVEPIAVLGIVSSLVYLFYQNQN